MIKAVLSSVGSVDVQHAPASGGRIQHGTVAGSFVNQGDGTESDLSATAQTFLLNTGAFFDGEGDNVIPYITTLATTAIGDLYAPRGGGQERCLLIPTERGFSIVYEHGHDDVPVGVQPGERWMLHRGAPPAGVYASAVYDAGVRLLNDGPTSNDGLGTTEVGYQGAQTVVQTKGGWKIVEDDTANKLTVTLPSSSIAVEIDANGEVKLAGSAAPPDDALIRKSDLDAAFGAFRTLLQAYISANCTHGAQTAPAIGAPTTSGSTKTFSG